MQRLLLALALLAAMSTLPALAQDDAASSTESEEALWALRLVAFGQYFPAYPASADQNPTLLPLPFPVYRGKFLRFGENLENLAEGRFVDNDRVRFSIGANGTFPEDSDNLDTRAGMPDLDLLAEIGPELQLTLAGGRDESRELKLSVELRGAVSFDGVDPSYRGLVLNPELEFLDRQSLGPKNELQLRLSSSWATRRYMDYFFGVPPEFATAERPAYAASSGYLNTELLLGFNRQISERLELRSSVRLWFNQGAANEVSPLYEQDFGGGIRVALFWTAWESRGGSNGKDRTAAEERAAGGG